MKMFLSLCALLLLGSRMCAGQYRATEISTAEVSTGVSLLTFQGQRDYFKPSAYYRIASAYYLYKGFGMSGSMTFDSYHMDNGVVAREIKTLYPASTISAQYKRWTQFSSLLGAIYTLPRGRLRADLQILFGISSFGFPQGSVWVSYPAPARQLYASEKFTGAAFSWALATKFRYDLSDKVYLGLSLQDNFSHIYDHDYTIVQLSNDSGNANVYTLKLNNVYAHIDFGLSMGMYFPE